MKQHGSMHAKTPSKRKQNVQWSTKVEFFKGTQGAMRIPRETKCHKALWLDLENGQDSTEGVRGEYLLWRNKECSIQEAKRESPLGSKNGCSTEEMRIRCVNGTNPSIKKKEKELGKLGMNLNGRRSDQNSLGHQ